jgi:hypothetical protein
VHGLCCIATEVLFANDGAVSRLQCRSKVATKASSTSETPVPTLTPPGRRIPAEATCRIVRSWNGRWVP